MPWMGMYWSMTNYIGTMFKKQDGQEMFQRKKTFQHKELGAPAGRQTKHPLKIPQA